jgi:membrane protease YdiL (CAAX protease family)
MSKRSKGIVSYVILAYAIAWVLWQIPIRLGIPPTDFRFQLLVLPGAFGPAIAAIVVRQWITREGFADAGLRLNLRRSWPYYLVGWLLPLAVVAVIILLAMLFGLGQPDFTAGPLVVAQVLVVALVATPILWGEEFGWRSYLQIRLLAERPVLAALATGVIWGLWHLPINLRGYNFPDQPPLVGMLLFTVATIILSVIFGWIRLRSGSVWAASLAHAATNSVGASLIVVFFAGHTSAFVAYLGILGWIPLGAVALWIVLTGRLRPGTVEGSSPAAPGSIDG